MAFMIKNKKVEQFIKRLTQLLLAQARSKPYIKSKVPEFKSVGEILASEEYWLKKEKQWRKFNNGKQ